MARRRKTRSRLEVILAVLVVVIASVYSLVRNETAQPAKSTAQGTGTSAGSGDTRVWFLDVGQGDSELIRLKTGQVILIDAGTRDTAQQLTDMLKELGVKKIDILIATHPHEDHIGGMASVVQNFPIGQIYMPKIPDSQVPTTAVYEKLLKAIDAKNLKITAARGQKTLIDDSGLKFELLGPNSDRYEDLNNYSVVAKLTCGEKSFLFMGDAETPSEKELLAKGLDLKSDVLKCGHHGSSTSTGAAFLKAVSPKYAIISCGVNNDYGHPHKEVLNRLNKANVTIYRTDLQDTILAVCDGKTIDFQAKQKSVIKGSPHSYEAAAPD